MLLKACVRPAKQSLPAEQTSTARQRAMCSTTRTTRSGGTCSSGQRRTTSTRPWPRGRSRQTAVPPVWSATTGRPRRRHSPRPSAGARAHQRRRPQEQRGRRGTSTKRVRTQAWLAGDVFLLLLLLLLLPFLQLRGRQHQHPAQPTVKARLCVLVWVL